MTNILAESEAENPVVNNEWYSNIYTPDNIKRQFDKDATIDLRLIYSYACNVIRGRWFEMESFIKSDGWYSYLYARDIIKGRWNEVEYSKESYNV
jgi:hypothetical protein